MTRRRRRHNVVPRVERKDARSRFFRPSVLVERSLGGGRVRVCVRFTRRARPHEARGRDDDDADADADADADDAARDDAEEHNDARIYVRDGRASVRSTARRARAGERRRERPRGAARRRPAVETLMDRGRRRGARDARRRIDERWTD